MSAARPFPLSLFAVFCLAGGPAAAAPWGAHTYEYARVEGKPLELDLYVSSDKPAAPPPLVVWIHGGGWTAGRKEDCPVVWLVQHGYAIASLEYRLAPSARFPAQIHDGKGAVRWLRAHAVERGYDKDRIAAAGHSAGGHLAALLATTGGVAELEGDVGGNAGESSRVQAALVAGGPVDFVIENATRVERALADDSAGPVRALLGGAPTEKADLARLASPVRHVTADDPPIFILHGVQDRVVPVFQAKALEAAYRAAGATVVLDIVPGEGHAAKPLFADSGRRAKIVEFLDRYLKHVAVDREKE